MTPSEAAAGLVGPVPEQQIRNRIPYHCDRQRQGSQVTRQTQHLVGIDKQQVAEGVVLYAIGN